LKIILFATFPPSNRIQYLFVKNEKITLTNFQVVQSLGENLKMRQQVISTAIVFFRRFYAKYSLKCIDPLLLAPTCIFLATKVEEFGLHAQQRFITGAAALRNAILFTS
jgi:cyclin C